MKTYKEFETLVIKSTKKELFKATAKSIHGVYKYAIDYYENIASNSNYFVMYTLNGKLQEWYCVNDYYYAIEVVKEWIK